MLLPNPFLFEYRFCKLFLFSNTVVKLSYSRSFRICKIELPIFSSNSILVPRKFCMITLLCRYFEIKIIVIAIHASVVWVIQIVQILRVIKSKSSAKQKITLFNNNYWTTTLCNIFLRNHILFKVTYSIR